MPSAITEPGSAPFDPGHILVGTAAGGVQRVSLAAGSTVDQALAGYRGRGEVLFAEPDYIVHATGIPDDPLFGQQYNLHNTGQSGGLADADIDAPEAWNLTTGSTKTLVGVIDTGVDYRHRDLYLNIWINQGEIPANLGSQDVDADGLITFRDLNHPVNAGHTTDLNANGYIDGGDLLNDARWENGADNDGNSRIDDLIGWDFANNDNDPFDDNGHGTHVAGTIGAVGGNAVGVAGVTWQVQLAPIKFLDANGSGSISTAVAALNYAVGEGIRLSNNSWSGGGFSTALFTAIQDSQSIGHVFVAAAGNAGSNNDTTPQYPASYALGNIISVTATDRNDSIPIFSNVGAASVDLAAPGVSILSTTPGDTYSVFSGTSMATPHVTGAVALVLSQTPGLSSPQVIQRVLDGTDPVPALYGKTVTGGRLNVLRALLGTTTDESGPRVVAAALDAGGADPVSSVRVTFSEAVEPSHFTPADARLNGPNGAIQVTGVTPVPGTNNTQFMVAFSTQSVPGAYSMTIGPGVYDTAGNVMDQDQDGVGGEATEDQFTAPFTISPRRVFSNTTPVLLPDRAIRTSTIVVGQNFTIRDLDVRLNITHTSDSDLLITLRGPDGTSVPLINRRGGSGDNFGNTTLNDEAQTPIGGGGAPFAGTYRPEAPLSAFDRKAATGTWTLTIADLGVFNSGRLNAWSLSFDSALGGIVFDPDGALTIASGPSPSAPMSFAELAQPQPLAPASTRLSLTWEQSDMPAPRDSGGFHTGFHKSREMPANTVGASARSKDRETNTIAREVIAGGYNLGLFEAHPATSIPKIYASASTDDMFAPVVVN